MFKFFNNTLRYIMHHILTPYSKATPPFATWEGGFSTQELDWLQRLAKNAEKKAMAGNIKNEEHLSKVRRSNVDWLQKNNETEWLFGRLSHIVSSLNAQYYNFDLTGFGEALQLTNYDCDNEGMYNWHQDYGSDNAPSRKMSLTLQLTDPSQYEGGNLQLMTSMQPINVPKQRGLVTVFPSFAVHQVAPVTRGSRQSLVAWITGPVFK